MSYGVAVDDCIREASGRVPVLNARCRESSKAIIRGRPPRRTASAAKRHCVGQQTEAAAQPVVSGSRRAGQLQTRQRPTLQEHAGGRTPTCRGSQRRTHSSAEGSVRSTTPPGQQPRRIADTSRAVSGSARAEIDWMCAAMRRSRGWSAIRHADTPRGGGRHIRIPDPASGGLRNARDALLIERHLSCDLLVRDTFDLAQVINDQAGLDGVALKLLVLADGGDLLRRAV